MKKIPYIHPKAVYIFTEQTSIMAATDIGDIDFPPGGGGGTDGDISGSDEGGNAKRGFGFGFYEDEE